jgi:dipeptidyl aminopeptidase/acylaminoacyl peptidase
MKFPRAEVLGIAVVAGAIAWPSSRVVAQLTTRPPAFTLDDEMTMRAVIDLRIAPDGEKVAYVVSTPSLTKNAHEAALFVVSSRRGSPQRVGEDVHIFNSPVPRPQIRWSPDSATISIVGLTPGGPQVFAIPWSGGAARQLTKAPEGVSGYEWSPDGKRLAYLTSDPMPADEARQRQDQSFVIHVGVPDRATRLVTQAVDALQSTAGGAARTLTPASQYVDAFSWSPDGRELAYSAAPRTGFGATYQTRIYAVAANASQQSDGDQSAPRAGTWRTIVDRPGMNDGPRFSPDGRSIAFTSTSGGMDIMASRSLSIVPADGGPIRTFRLDDAWVREMVWARDSRSIYLTANDGTFGRGEHMFEQPVVRVSVEDGRATQVVDGQTVDYSISLSNDGRRLAYRAVEGRTMGDVFVQDTASGQRTKITDLNPELRGRALGDLKPVSWRSFDGMEIWGLVLTPPGRTAGRALPLLVYIHGGPGGGVTHGLFPQFMHTVPQVDPYPTEAMASAGFAVFFPMPRGGAGYGEAGQRAIVNAWGEADYKDIMTGVDALIARGLADPQRLGVMGASYGGYMTNWIVTQTGRFTAASAGASLTDLPDNYYLSEGGEFMVGYFKRPWENRESYAAHSPLTFVERVTTPLLIQHGERDARVAIQNAWKFYRALKALGKTVEFDIYPRGGHVLYEPMLEREQMRRNVEWFTRWIPPR